MERDGVGDGGEWEAKGGLHHTVEQKAAITCSMKNTNSHGLFVRLRQSLTAVSHQV